MSPVWVRRGVVGSTNDEAADLARRGAPDGTVVTAEAQTRGRGRRAARFLSPPGNLYLSAVLRPPCAPAAACQLGFAAGLAVAETVAERLPGSAVAVKWPNDVRVGGAKIAGVLLESEIEADRLLWAIVGIGINVASHPSGLPYPATSLAAEGATDVDPNGLARPLVERLLRWRDRWLAEGFGPVRQAWLARAHGLGAAVRVNLERETIEGRFEGLDPDGALLLALPRGGSRRVTAGEVFFPSAA